MLVLSLAGVGYFPALGSDAVNTSQRSPSQDRLPHAAASCFALVIHLVSRLLPMPLAVDDAKWPGACFWAGDQARAAAGLSW